MFAVDFPAVYDNVENPFVSDNRFDRNLLFAKLGRQFSRQTGGLWRVVSHSAIDNLNLHHVPPQDLQPRQY